MGHAAWKARLTELKETNPCDPGSNLLDIEGESEHRKKLCCDCQLVAVFQTSFTLQRISFKVRKIGGCQ